MLSVVARFALLVFTFLAAPILGAVELQNCEAPLVDMPSSLTSDDIPKIIQAMGAKGKIPTSSQIRADRSEETSALIQRVTGLNLTGRQVWTYINRHGSSWEKAVTAAGVHSSKFSAIPSRGLSLEKAVLAVQALAAASPPISLKPLEISKDLSDRSREIIEAASQFYLTGAQLYSWAIGDSGPSWGGLLKAAAIDTRGVMIHSPKISDDEIIAFLKLAALRPGEMRPKLNIGALLFDRTIRTAEIAKQATGRWLTGAQIAKSARHRKSWDQWLKLAGLDPAEERKIISIRGPLTAEEKAERLRFQDVMCNNTGLVFVDGKVTQIAVDNHTPEDELIRKETDDCVLDRFLLSLSQRDQKIVQGLLDYFDREDVTTNFTNMAEFIGESPGDIAKVFQLIRTNEEIKSYFKSSFSLNRD